MNPSRQLAIRKTCGWVILELSGNPRELLLNSFSIMVRELQHLLVKNLGQISLFCRDEWFVILMQYEQGCLSTYWTIDHNTKYGCPVFSANESRCAACFSHELHFWHC